MKNKRPEIIIVMDGGLVQEVLSTHPVDVTVVDYDVEGALEDELTPIPQTSSTDTADAYVTAGYPVQVIPTRVDEILRAIERFREEQE